MSDPPRQNIVHHMLSSVQFLSRLPVHRLAPDLGPIDFSKSAYTIPIASLLIAVPSALVLYVGMATELDALLTSLIAIIVQLLVTGALHEDGLADVADGFWGGATRERKLEIMRDSAIGTYGVLALICTISLRVLFLATLVSQFGTVWAVSGYMAFESLSRLAILSSWTALRPARPADDEKKPAKISGKVESGLSVQHGEPMLADFFRATGCALPAIVMLVFTVGASVTLVSLLGGALFTGVIVLVADKHIGGHTGDVLGATQQVSLWGLYLGMLLAI